MCCKKFTNERTRGADLFGFFGIFAGQSAFVEQFVLATSDQSWVSVCAEEKAVWISGVGIPWERPEAGGCGVWVDTSWALEADDSFRVALVKQKVGPVASVDFFVVNQSLCAGQEVWNSELALDVAGGAFGTLFIDSELVFASRS